MSVKSFISVAAVAAVTGLAASVASASITIPTVPIGNPGNSAHPTQGYGSVAYTYNIGTTEVTNAQYAAFLNAVAATDTNALYNTGMAGPFGGITRSGSAGSYTYATMSGRANNPVNFVSFWDATRFANWLHNGQPTGAQNNTTTEDGAYTLGGVTNPVNASITRNAGWQWALPNENEWLKAASYQPASQGGPPSNYWPNAAPDVFQSNYFGNGINNTTPVGSYAPNFYGAFDMAGNVWEWSDGINQEFYRFVFGGSFGGSGIIFPEMGATYGSLPTIENSEWGLRVVQVPGPGSIALLAIGGVGALRRRRGVGR